MGICGTRVKIASSVPTCQQITNWYLERSVKKWWKKLSFKRAAQEKSWPARRGQLHVLQRDETSFCDISCYLSES